MSIIKAPCRIEVVTALLQRNEYHALLVLGGAFSLFSLFFQWRGLGIIVDSTPKKFTVADGASSETLGIDKSVPIFFDKLNVPLYLSLTSEYKLKQSGMMKRLKIYPYRLTWPDAQKYRRKT